MSSSPLKSLTVEYLRGAITPFTIQFERNKKLTVIYGENGVGKSTICDAFDFIGNGKVGSLDNRRLGRPGKYWHTIGKNPTDTPVTLESSSGRCKAILSGRAVQVDPEEHLPHVIVFRRSQILDLVEAQPAKRYDSVRHFIDVAAVEPSETSLRALIRDIEGQAEVAIARVQENRDTIASFWQQAGMPEDDPNQWAQNQVARDISSFEVTRTAIDLLREAFAKLASHPNNIRAFKDNISNIETTIGALQKNVAALNQQIAGEYVEILDILEAAQTHFANHPDPEVCALCESAEKVAGLPATVTQRIDSQAAASQLKASKTKLAQQNSLLKQKQHALNGLKDVAGHDADKLVEAAADDALPAEIDLPELPCSDNVEDWEAWLANAIELPEKWRVLSDNCADRKLFIDTLKVALDTWSRAV